MTRIHVKQDRFGVFYGLWPKLNYILTQDVAFFFKESEKLFRGSQEKILLLHPKYFCLNLGIDQKNQANKFTDFEMRAPAA